VVAKVKQTNPGWLKELAKRYKKGGEVAIGFPAGTDSVGLSYPDGTLVLDVAVWQQYGVPGHIPRRDYMGSGGRAASEKAKPIAVHAVRAINRGKVDIESTLNQMGAVGASEISQAIVMLSDPPNAESTIRAKKSSNPLVDTGLLAGAPTWIIR